MEQYIEYLRKSQMDRDFDEVSVEETLARHRKRLGEFIQQRKLNVTVVLEEVVSGESLASRPQMLKCLELINTGEYAGVVCMDIDRLSRGDSMDSGYIMQVLKINGCKIITPDKTYDLENDSDEQFTDMKFLFSRFELKTITKRLQRGKEASVREGKYVGSARPYGYETTKLQGIKGSTLKIVPEEAKIVQLIYDMYVNQHIGFQGIANQLNDMHMPPKETVPQWTRTGVMTILKNPIYTGKIRYHWTRTKKVVEDGKIVKTRVWTPNDYEVYDGLHEAIIPEEMWQKAQEIREKKLISHKPKQCAVRNPFATLMKCSYCDKPMQYTNSTHPGGRPKYQCRTHHCPNKSILCEVFDTAVVSEMRKWLDQYTVTVQDTEPTNDDSLNTALEMVQKQLASSQQQQDRICELLETGVYSIEVFTKRNAVLQDEIKKLKEAEVDLQKRIEEYDETMNRRKHIVPTVQKILDTYEELDAEAQNKLWKEVLEKIDYARPETGGDFTIKLYPRI